MLTQFDYVLLACWLMVAYLVGKNLRNLSDIERLLLDSGHYRVRLPLIVWLLPIIPIVIIYRALG